MIIKIYLTNGNSFELTDVTCGFEDVVRSIFKSGYVIDNFHEVAFGSNQIIEIRRIS